jgi:hypothetical protein
MSQSSPIFKRRRCKTQYLNRSHAVSFVTIINHPTWSVSEFPSAPVSSLASIYDLYALRKGPWERCSRWEQELFLGAPCSSDREYQPSLDYFKFAEFGWCLCSGVFNQWVRLLGICSLATSLRMKQLWVSSYLRRTLRFLEFSAFRFFCIFGTLIFFKATIL